MAMTLAEIRAKLQAQENRGGGQRQQGDSAVYAHWIIFLKNQRLTSS